MDGSSSFHDLLLGQVVGPTLATFDSNFLGLQFAIESKYRQRHTERTPSAIGDGGTEAGVKAGHGPKPSRGQSVTVHCTGFGKNGDLSQKFWSTKDPGQQPFTFKIGLGSVIKGWDEGVMDMQIGEIARLECTPDYAYGSGGFPAWGIQPNSVLVFEIEVLNAH